MLLTRRFWLGLVVTLAFLFLFLWKVKLGETVEELQHANYALYIPAVMLYFVALGFRSFRWRYLLLHIKPIPVRRLYPVVTIGYLSNNILPVRLGELVRAHYLGEKEGISKASALATVGVERIFDGLTLLFFTAVIWPFLPWTEVLKTNSGGFNAVWIVMSVLVALAFVAGFLTLFLLASSPTLGGKFARLLGLLSTQRMRPKVEEFILLLMDGLGALGRPSRLLFISLVSVPVWLTEAAMYYILSISFGLDQPFQVILLVTATSNLATAIPSSIGGIGPFEVVAKSTLLAFGVGPEVAAAYVFFVHIVALWLPVNLLGMFFLWKENLSLRQLSSAGRIDPQSPPSESVTHLHGFPRAHGYDRVERAERPIFIGDEESE